MEEKKFNGAVNLRPDEVEGVTGGAAASYRGGYCPYPEDRTCRVEAVGHWDNDNQICRECSWRAW